MKSTSAPTERGKREKREEREKEREGDTQRKGGVKRGRETGTAGGNRERKTEKDTHTEREQRYWLGYIL